MAEPMAPGELGLDLGYKWAREWPAKRITVKVDGEMANPVAIVTQTGFVAGACVWVAEEAQTAQLGMGQN